MSGVQALSETNLPEGPANLAASTSGTSTTAAGKRKRLDPEVGKVWLCDYPGCGKSFVRSDHLGRHKRNHSDKETYTCTRCPIARTFVRADLLKRHEERHDKREASGQQSVKPGRIKGANSRRKDPEVLLLDEGPAPPPAAWQPSTDPIAGPSSSVLPTAEEITAALQSVSSAPLSASSSSNGLALPPPLDSQSQPSTLSTPFTQPGNDSYNADRITSLLAPQRQRSPSPSFSGANILLDFNNFLTPSLHVTHNDARLATASLSVPNITNNGLATPASQVAPATASPGAFAGVGVHADAPFLSHEETNWLFTYGSNSNMQTTPNIPLPPDLASAVSMQMHQRRMTFPGSIPQSILKNPYGTVTSTATPSARKQTHFVDDHLQPLRQNTDPTPLPSSNPPIQHQQHTQYIHPIPLVVDVTAQARERLLQYLQPLRDLSQDVLFSIANLSEYLHRFLEWDMSHYSLLHRPTFQSEEIDPALLCAVITIGCFFTSTDAYELGNDIHRFNLQTLLASPKFKARADLSTIQATLLISIYGRTMSTIEIHEHTHMLYPAFQIMYRRSGIYSDSSSQNEATAPTDHTEHWKAWRHEESSRRAAFASYAFDILCSMIFRQTAILSAFQISLTLPCNEDEWHAASAAEWHRRYTTAPKPPSFLPTLKAFLVPGLTSPDISPLARSICLLGLLSVAFDMQWREFFLLGLSTHPDGLVKEWRLTLTSAYNCWKSRFDAALTNDPAALGTQLLRNAIPIYAIAHCTLAIDIDDLQIFAGAKRALGLPVNIAVTEATRRRVIGWSGTKGKEAAWHAAHFLRANLLTRRPISDGRVHPSYLGWCLYLAALCVHAYATAVTVARSGTLNDGDRYMDPLTYLDGLCTPTPDSLGVSDIGRHLGLMDAVLDVLAEDTRWGIAAEAREILGGIPGEG